MSAKENPKAKFGVAKPGFSAIPPVAMLLEGLSMSQGAAKYGKFNWNNDPISASVYYDSAMRHLTSWYSGDNIDADSRLPNLAHARANLGILLDAELTGNLIDDRPKMAKVSALIEKYTKK
jgi:hypothetical protein